MKPKTSFEARLIASMRQAVAIAKGKQQPAKLYQLPLNAKVATVREAPVFTADAVAAIRTQLNFSQAIFARALNVSTNTVQSWEQGVQTPHGASRRLLEIAYKKPDVLRTIVTERVAPRPKAAKRIARAATSVKAKQRTK